MIEPEHLTHFWGPVGVSTPIENITVDPRPGGVFETIMVNDADGEEYPSRGVFVEVVEPERLVWTEPDVEGGMTTSSTFTDLGDGRTEVVRPPDERPRDVPQPRGAGRHAEQLRPLRRLPRDAVTAGRGSTGQSSSPALRRQWGGSVYRPRRLGQRSGDMPMNEHSNFVVPAHEPSQIEERTTLCQHGRVEEARWRRREHITCCPIPTRGPSR